MWPRQRRQAALIFSLAVYWLGDAGVNKIFPKTTYGIREAYLGFRPETPGNWDQPAAEHPARLKGRRDASARWDRSRSVCQLFLAHPSYRSSSFRSQGL
jgi:hypothetical protein